MLRGADDSFTSDGGMHEQSAARANKETTRLLFLIGSFSFVMPNSRGIWVLLTNMTTKSVKSVHNLNDRLRFVNKVDLVIGANHPL